MLCFVILQITLLALMLCFLVRGVLGCLREGYTYLLSAWRLLGICKLALAAAVCGLHLSRCTMAKQQWASYMKHPLDGFTDFYPLAKQTHMYTVTSALLLFILVLKVSSLQRLHGQDTMSYVWVKREVKNPSQFELKSSNAYFCLSTIKRNKKYHLCIESLI